MSESLNHLCPSAPGKGNRGAVSSLFRVEQFFFFLNNLLEETSKALSSGFDGLCVAVPQVGHPHRSLIPVCEGEWLHPDRRMDRTCFHSFGPKAAL